MEDLGTGIAIANRANNPGIGIADANKADKFGTNTAIADRANKLGTNTANADKEADNSSTDIANVNGVNNQGSEWKGAIGNCRQ